MKAIFDRLVKIMQKTHGSHEQSAVLQRNNSGYKKITNEAEALRKRRETKMSILGTVMKSIMASREREAQRYVARVLAGMDDVTLNALGKSREGLKKGPF